MNESPFATLRQRRDDCLSDLHLDRLAAGEFIGQAARAHINACSVCTQQLQERRDDQARFNDMRNSADLASGAERALLGARKSPGATNQSRDLRNRYGKIKARPALAMTAAAAAATILLAVLPRTTPDIRTKGSTSLRIITATDPDHALRDGDTVHVGERLRFLVDTETPVFVAILGRDSTGSVWNAAAAQTGMTHLSAGKDHLLPGAVALDAKGVAEDIHLFACVQQTDLQKLVASITDANRSTLPADCTAIRTRVRKAFK